MVLTLTVIIKLFYSLLLSMTVCRPCRRLCDQ